MDALGCEQYVRWLMNERLVFFLATALTLVCREHQRCESATCSNDGGSISGTQTDKFDGHREAGK